MIARQTVLADVIGIIGELMGDWDFDAEVREDSLIFKDLGLESIENQRILPDLRIEIDHLALASPPPDA